MIRSRASIKSGRSGFTLIEILVVIAIIAILVALIVPAVMNVIQKREQVQNFDEIFQVGAAIGECKTGLKLDQIPAGPFALKQHYNGTEPELTILLRAFPQLNWQAGTVGTGLIPTVTNVNDTTTTCYLDSNQTLLFFLTGGSITGFNGFSTNPQFPFIQPGNPGNNAGDSRKGPYLKLAPQYLSLAPKDSGHIATLISTTSNYYNGTTSVPITVTVGAQAPAQGWLVDAYGMPLAYFAAVNGKNGLYYAPLTNTSLSFNTVAPVYQSYSITNSLGTSTVTPYMSNGAFINPSGYQIISAGRNLEFGAGFTLLPAHGVGTDDQANFSKTTLGSGIN